MLTLRTEEIGSREIFPFYQEWDDHYYKITDWAFLEQDYARDMLLEAKGADFIDVSERLCDSILIKSFNSLRKAAKHAHETYPAISEDLWLYYYYAQSLKEVLVEFEKIVKEEAIPYGERCKENQALFNDIHKILEQHYPSLDVESRATKSTLESLLADLDSFSIQLGREWHEAVLETIQNK